MFWLNENKFNISIIYLNLIFTMTLMRICYRIQDFNHVLVTAIFMATMVSYYFYSAILRKFIYKALFFSVIQLILISMVIMKKFLVVKYIRLWFLNNYYNINDLLYRGATTDFYLFKPFIIAVLPVCSMILVFLYSKGITETVLVLNLILLLMFLKLGYTSEVQSLLLVYLFISIGTYLVNNYIKCLSGALKSGVRNYISFKSILVNIILYSASVAFIAVVINHNYSENTAKEVMGEWSKSSLPDIKEASGNAKLEGYGVSKSGYSNTESKLGGPITLDNQIAFKVKSDKPLYLRGAVKDIYTGKAWIKSGENYQVKTEAEDTNAVRFLNDIFNNTSQINKMFITIIPQGLLTNTLFVPYYSSKVYVDKGKTYFETNSHTFINSSKIKKEYTIEFYDPDLVEDFVDSTSLMQDIVVSRGKNDRYLYVPKNISLRTEELVYNITKDSRTNKDKVEAIHKYLSSTYRYSLDVSEVPENSEFLDYFLFTERKGYCTYFATAMTVMCRIAGIPARYVEGFKMSSQSKNGIYDVTNKQAHAWTEILYNDKPQLWIVKDCSPTLEEVSQITTIIEAGETTIPQNNAVITDEEEKTWEQRGSGKFSAGSLRGIDTAVLYSSIVVVSVLIIAILYITIRVILFLKMRYYVLNSSSNIPFYNYCLKRLNSAGIRKPDTVTDKEFINIIDRVEIRDNMEELVERVYEEFYGGLRASNFNKSCFYKVLEEYVKSKQNMFIYHARKFLT